MFQLFLQGSSLEGLGHGRLVQITGEKGGSVADDGLRGQDRRGICHIRVFLEGGAYGEDVKDPCGPDFIGFVTDSVYAIFTGLINEFGHRIHFAARKGAEKSLNATPNAKREDT